VGGFISGGLEAGVFNINQTEIKMQKVLLPFDGSESARRALQYLVTAARSYPGLEVHVLNVQPTIILHGDYLSLDMLKKLDDGALQHAAEINAEAIKLLTAANIRCFGHETIGEVIGAVGKAVQDLGCDTVVMGTRGMSNLSNLMLGSVATRVVHEVTVPVLLVK